MDYIFLNMNVFKQTNISPSSSCLCRCWQISILHNLACVTFKCYFVRDRRYLTVVHLKNNTFTQQTWTGRSLKPQTALVITWALNIIFTSSRWALARRHQLISAVLPCYHYPWSTAATIGPFPPYNQPHFSTNFEDFPPTKAPVTAQKSKTKPTKLSARAKNKPLGLAGAWLAFLTKKWPPTPLWLPFLYSTPS